MASSEMEVKQSSGVAVVTIIRTHGRKGAVELPWFAEQVSSGRAQRKPTSYDILEGKVCHSQILLKLSYCLIRCSKTHLIQICQIQPNYVIQCYYISHSPRLVSIF